MNLITQYDNGTFEGLQADWDADSSLYTLTQDNTVFFEGANSVRLDMVDVDADSVPAGFLGSLNAKFPGFKNVAYRVSCRVKVSMDFPDNIVLFLFPNNQDFTHEDGYTVPVRASRAKSDWIELNMYFYGQLGAGNISFEVGTLLKSSTFATLMQTLPGEQVNFYSRVLNYQVDEDIPAGAKIWVDKIVCEQTIIPLNTGPQFEGRSLYHVKNVFLLSNGLQTIEIDEPIQWSNIDISILLDTTLYGYKFEFTDGEVLLEFDEAAGRSMINKAFKDKFEGMDITLQFGELNSANVLTILYEATLNFDSISIGKYTTKANCERKSFGDKFRTRYDTAVDIRSRNSVEGVFLDALPMRELFLHPRILTHQALGVYDTVVDPTDIELTDEIPGTGSEAWKTTVPPFKFTANNVNDLDEPTVPAGELIYAGLTLPPGITKRVFFFDVSLSFKFTMGNQSGFIRAGFSIYRRPGISTGDDDLFPPYDQSIVGTEGLVAAEAYGNVAIPPNRTFAGRASGVLTLTGDDAIFIKVWFYTPNDSLFPISDFEYTQIQVHSFLCNEQTIYQASTASVPLLHEALNRQLEIILDTPLPLKSDFAGRIDLGYAANGCASMQTVMNGLMIRKFTDRPFNMSTKDWFTALAGIYCMGIGIEYDDDNNAFIRFEPVQHFFQNKLLFHFAVISDYEKHPDIQYVFNQLKFGFQKFPQDNQQDSLEDWMTQFEYIFDKIRTVKTKLEQIITWILSPYYIEYTRQQSFNTNPNNAYETDNDTFMISTVDGTVYTGVDITFDQGNQKIIVMDVVALLKGESFVISGATGAVTNGTYQIADIEIPYAYDRTIITTVDPIATDGDGTGTITLSAPRLKAKRNEDFDMTAGVKSPESVYNLEHHIKRIVLRWAKIFNAGAFLASATGIKFTTGKNNIDVTTRLKDSVSCRLGSVSEPYGDVNYEVMPGSMEAPLFKGNIIQFGAPITWELLNGFRLAFEGRHPDDLDYGYFEWRNPDGEIEKGFILSMKFNPGTQVVKCQMLEKYG
jgi:hypothetical protein